ncbi:MAG TPA: ATP-binding protein [Caulobacteraceae bacterium]|nr:ATP-binding protein [Caulobacteraceae bacterium]
MSEPVKGRDPSTPRRGPDPLMLAGAACFLAAIMAALYPMATAGPVMGAAALLLLGIAGVAFLALLVFRQPPAGVGLEAAQWLDALSEPSALLSMDGRPMSANAAWRAIPGAMRRLGRSNGGAALFAALKASRADRTALAALTLGGQEWRVSVSRLDERSLLVRLSAPAQAAPAPEVRDSLPRSAAAHAARLDPLAEAAPFGAAVLDGEDPFESLILGVNPALERISQGRAREGATLGPLFEPASRAEVLARIQAVRPGAVEVKLALDPPRTAQLHLTRLQGRTLAYLVDVSEQKQLELQLAQSQKMQAIGQLAGGVAHDFNNLLTAIQLRLDELLLRHPVGDPSYEGLNEIRQTGVRAADLVRKLLAFSRKQTVQREILDLGELISEFEVLLRRLLREDVKLETEYGRNLPLVRADKSQLETAVMNLAVNARDAMRSQGRDVPGLVRIRTARVSQAEAMALGYGAAPAAGCALIEVADTGPGMSPDIQAKIFEPFFTTKAVGEGTGLGLATVYGIVKQADGWIHVQSAPGEGAAFRIFLPVHEPVAGALAAPVVEAPKARPAARDLSGAGRILFVEDEDAVRGVAARLLRARGYEVIEAADGEEALVLAEEYAGKIDLLISDVIMPGLDGPTLLKKARKFLGEAPVMFISGYAEAEFSDLLEGETGVTFLPKPLDIKILAERVKQQLAA